MRELMKRWTYLLYASVLGTIICILFGTPMSTKDVLGLSLGFPDNSEGQAQGQ